MLLFDEGMDGIDRYVYIYRGQIEYVYGAVGIELMDVKSHRAKRCMYLRSRIYGPLNFGVGGKTKLISPIYIFWEF
jgi:hypothetical protein